MAEVRSVWFALLAVVSFALTFFVPVNSSTQTVKVHGYKHGYHDIIKHYVEVDTGKKYPDSYTTGPDNDHLITVKCPGGRVIMDYDMDYSPLAAAQGASVIMLNPKLMKSMPWQARLFAFAHECGHLNNGDDESEADHYAVKKGVKEGWLKEDWLQPICEDYGDAPSDGEHPSGATRCMQNARWYAQEVGSTETKTEEDKPVIKPLPEPTYKGESARKWWMPWWWPKGE
jgi:hypothetical protein